MSFSVDNRLQHGQGAQRGTQILLRSGARGFSAERVALNRAAMAVIVLLASVGASAGLISIWGGAHLPGNIDLQAFVAARHARWALATCHDDARCAFRLLGGLRSDVPLKGEEKRLASFERARRRL